MWWPCAAQVPVNIIERPGEIGQEPSSDKQSGPYSCRPNIGKHYELSVECAGGEPRAQLAVRLFSSDTGGA